MPQIPVHRRCQRGIVRGKGVRVGKDHAVLQPDDAGGILLGQLRVVGDHDHQTVLGNFLQQLHHLNACLTVQRTGGLVRQQDAGIVHQCTGNGHALHLAAGHLAGVLVQLIAQPHLGQCFGGAAAALGLGDAGNGQRQLYVGKHRLVRDQVITLEHEADGVVAVGVPVAIGVLVGGNAVDHQIAAVITVQTADDVQQSGFAGAGRAQNGNEFVIPQVEAYIIQRFLDKIAGPVFFFDVFELEHVLKPFRCILQCILKKGAVVHRRIKRSGSAHKGRMLYLTIISKQYEKTVYIRTKIYAQGWMASLNGRIAAKT